MSDPQYLYPFDPTGKAVTNKVVGEQQIISPPSWTDFYFIIPKMAPFFKEGLRVIHRPSGATLVEGTDYHLTHRFMDATMGTAKPVFGSITFLDKSLVGAVELFYQTLGGRWILDEQKVIEILSNTKLNPRITTWEQVIGGMPVKFPPIDHDWHLDDMVGMKEVTDAVAAIAEALGAEGGVGDSHLTDRNNPHRVTKAQVGLDKVPNYDVANRDEAEQGIAADKFMTPQRTSQAIDKKVGEIVGEHANNKDNPHEVTKTHVGLPLVPNWSPSNEAAAAEGIAENLFMSPATTRHAIEERVGKALRSHVQDQGNPHDVTAEQVGTYNKSQIDELLSGRLGRNETAGDSYLLEGHSLAQVTSAAILAVSEQIDAIRGESGGGGGSGAPQGNIKIHVPVGEVRYIRLAGVGLVPPSQVSATTGELLPPPEEGDEWEPAPVDIPPGPHPDFSFLLTTTSKAGEKTEQIVRVDVEARRVRSILNLRDLPVPGQLGITEFTVPPEEGETEEQDGGYHIWLKVSDDIISVSYTVLSPSTMYGYSTSFYMDEPEGIVYGPAPTVPMTPESTRAAVISVLDEVGIYYDEDLGKWVLDSDRSGGSSPPTSSGIENPYLYLLEQLNAAPPPANTPHDPNINLELRFHGDWNKGDPEWSFIQYTEDYPVPFKSYYAPKGIEFSVNREWNYDYNDQREIKGAFPAKVVYPGLKSANFHIEATLAANVRSALEMDFVKAAGASTGGIDWIIPYEITWRGTDYVVDFSHLKYFFIGIVHKDVDPSDIDFSKVYAGIHAYRDGSNVQFIQYLKSGQVFAEGPLEPDPWDPYLDRLFYYPDVGEAIMRYSSDMVLGDDPPYRSYSDTPIDPMFRNAKIIIVAEPPANYDISLKLGMMTDPAFVY